MKRTTIEKTALILVACLSLSAFVFGGSVIIGAGETLSAQPIAGPSVLAPRSGAGQQRF